VMLEFRQYLLEPRVWTRLPADWREIFGREAKLAVEIGFGNGEFLAEEASRCPDWDFVGFEVSLKCIEKAGRKLAQAGVRNVRLVLLDGRFGLRELFPDGSVERVIVNFPCPWPKARHAGRRLVREDFPRTLGAVLREGGRFELTSDHLPFLEEAREALEGCGCFVLEGPSPVEGVPRTRYERKWRLRGLEIRRLVARKVKGTGVERIAEGTMPHVHVPKELSPEEILRVRGLKEVWPEGSFVVKEGYISPDGGEVLLRAHATDRGFHQHYFILVHREKDGWMVKLDGASLPFRTPAVKRSVAAVGEYLLRKGG